MQQALCSAASARPSGRGYRFLFRRVGGSLMTLGVALLCQVMLSGASFAQTAPPPSLPDIPPGSLKAVKIQDPPNLGDFVVDRQAAVQLGKAAHCSDVLCTGPIQDYIPLCLPSIALDLQAITPTTS